MSYPLRVPGEREEFELLCLCARTRRDEGRDARLRVLLKGPPDWDRLVALALRQRVVPLVFLTLRDAGAGPEPEGFLDTLREYFCLNAARACRMTDELARLLTLCGRRGIHVIPFKGPALGVQVYGDAALRQFSDLDLLVRPGDLPRAASLLSEEGYRASSPPPAAHARDFLRVYCSAEFCREGEPPHLDVHWAFVPRFFSLSLDAEGFRARSRPLRVGEAETRAFAPEDLLLILSVHASKDFWERLVWVCDIAELIDGNASLDWEAVFDRARAAGARRALLVSLLLARDLLGARLPPRVSAEADSDRGARSVAARAAREMSGERPKTRGIRRVLLLVETHERPAAKLRFLLRLALTPTLGDWRFVPLPRRLSFLHYATRPARLALKYLRPGRRTPERS